jgi:lysozyme
LDILEQLTRDEGTRSFPYPDTAGKITIGVGFNLTDVGLYPEEIEFMLQYRVGKLTRQLADRLPYFSALDPIRQAVLVNMSYNLGFDGLEKFPLMLSAIAKGKWAEASDEMLGSLWARQVGDRAKRLALQMRSGIWQ